MVIEVTSTFFYIIHIKYEYKCVDLLIINNIYCIYTFTLPSYCKQTSHCVKKHKLPGL